MREHILVCQYHENLINRLHHKQVVVKISDFEQIHPVCKQLNDVQVGLHCLMIQHNGSIASIPFHESWKGIPIAIYANEMGTMKELMGRLPLIRDLNIRIFLNSDLEANYTSLHIMASLGIECGLYFGNKEKINWELVNDLMTYAIYGKVNHAPLEPFYHLASHYNPEQHTDFNSVYFENPLTYLHIDHEENIAASSEDLDNKKFIAKGIDSLERISENNKYDEAIHAWQQFFLKPDGCAYCQAWRVCLGKFSESVKVNEGCKPFFVDMMEACDHFLSMQHKNKKKEVWQP